MKTFLQSNHSGSRNRCVGTIIIDHQFVIDVQDTTVVQTGLESMNSIFRILINPEKYWNDPLLALFMEGSGMTSIPITVNSLHQPLSGSAFKVLIRCYRSG